MYDLRKTISRAALSCALAAGLSGLAAGAGCNKDSGANPGGTANPGAKVNGTVAVVDLDRVTLQIGWKGEFEDDTRAAKAEAQRQLQVFADGVLAQWEARKKSISDAAHLTAEQQKTLNGGNGDDIQKLPLSREQRDELLQGANQVNRAVNDANQLVNQRFGEREVRIRDMYREAIKPAVRRVAVSAGISMIITPVPQANPIFYYDPGVDLSDQVVDDLRKAMPQHTIPEMPKVTFTPFRFTALPPMPGATTQPR